jgi:prolyl oligopeptidase
MLRALRLSAAGLAATLLIAAGPFNGPPPLPPTPAPPAAGNVSDTYFGTVVPDPYRQFEDAKNPALLNYFKAQNTYTRSILDALPGRTALGARVAQLDGGSESLSDVTVTPGLRFYLKRPVGANTTSLYVRPSAGGAERLVLNPDRFASGKDQHETIDFYSVSPDNRYVAVGAAEGGSENETTRVIEVASGRVLGDTIDRTPFFAPTWRPDSRSFYYFRTPKLAPNAPQSARDTNGVALLHVLGRNPDRDAVIFGYHVDPHIPIAPEDGTGIVLTPGSRWAVALIAHGVQNEIAAYVAPAAALATGRHVPWRKIISFSDDVTGMAIDGDFAYVLTHHNAPRYRIDIFSLESSSAPHANVAVPQSANVIEAIQLGRDALYTRELDRGVSRVRRFPRSTTPSGGGTTARSGYGAGMMLKLPYDGAVGELDADPRVAGAVLVEQGWTHSPLWYAVDGAGSLHDTGLRKPSTIDYSGITSREVSARSADGTLVPLSIVMRKDLKHDGKNRTLLDGYGAYGYVIRPSFSPTRLAWLERGGVFAECHPRGGGELGEAWHLGAHIATKQRTIDDFIGCANYLILHGFTSPPYLAGMGTSAGGVTIGNAIIQRPALFGAAIDNVGDTNGVRDEFAEGGPANIPEFGTNTKPVDFKALYATDAYVQMKPGVAYPAVLAITGANDPRVAPWVVGKFIAKLQASTTSGKPVLLRVDFDAGHGLLGSSRAQAQAFTTDLYAFLFWQLGDPAFAYPGYVAPPTPSATP